LPTFGEKLRKQRELRGISIEAIANTTKISTRMLRAIEDEHFDQLPGGVFNKGFVRAYARQVGLDEDETVAEYLVALRDGQMSAQAISPNFRPVVPPSRMAAHASLERTLAEEEDEQNAAEDSSAAANTPAVNLAPKASIEIPRDEPAEEEPGWEERKQEHGRSRDGIRLHERPEYDRLQDAPPRERRFQERRLTDRRRQERRNRHTLPQLSQRPRRVPWATLAAAMVLVVLLVWWARRRPEPSATTSALASPVSASVKSAALGTSARPVATAAGIHSSGVIAKPDGSSTTSGTSKSSVPPSNTIPAPPASAAEGKPQVERGSERTSKPAPASAKISPPARFTLLIRATQTSWISIMADGEPVARETLIAPAQTAVRATREIVIKTGNAAGISFRLNGKEIPASGESGEVKTYTFDASGLRPSNAAEASVPVP